MSGDGTFLSRRGQKVLRSVKTSSAEEDTMRIMCFLEEKECAL